MIPRDPRFVAMVTALLLAQAVGAQDLRLKIATLAPEGSYWMQELNRAADEIEERTRTVRSVNLLGR